MSRFRVTIPYVMGTTLLGPPARTLQPLHSGVVGDYVTWVIVGTAVAGGAWALLLR